MEHPFNTCNITLKQIIKNCLGVNRTIRIHVFKIAKLCLLHAVHGGIPGKTSTANILHSLAFHQGSTYVVTYGRIGIIPVGVELTWFIGTKRKWNGHERVATWIHRILDLIGIDKIVEEQIHHLFHGEPRETMCLEICQEVCEHVVQSACICAETVHLIHHTIWIGAVFRLQHACDRIPYLRNILTIKCIGKPNT